ncbi:MAG: hypothetical protein A3F13_02675 [Gammaproteobacteria bacterium RIFCSPHIGHO2_12_FULL_40_19]|nr:MAG: hypothetical protein A3F13_02675 [Gammaproteobacteria bacterium RIFCSPHIGHO2_12_FULL_40_19]
MSQFYPLMREISAITQAQNAVVTTTEDHDFVVNELVSFRVSRAYGMVEMNNLRGKVLAITSDTLTVDIDSSNFTAFSIPGDLTGTTPPCVVPSSSGVDLEADSPTMILEDAFDNRP